MPRACGSARRPAERHQHSALTPARPVKQLPPHLAGAVFVLPSPDPGSEPWGRFKIQATGGLAPANYAVRYNTSGGVTLVLPAEAC